MLCKNVCKLSVFSKAICYRKRPNLARTIQFQCPCRFRYIQQFRFLSSANFQNEAQTAPDNIIIDTVPQHIRRISKSYGMSTKTPEEFLEKLIAGLSSDIHQKNRVYKNDLVRVINKVKELNFSSKKQGLLLMRCCTELLPDEAPQSRMVLVELIWNTLKPHTKFEVEHYNELLRVYIANNRTLSVSSFIEKMKPVKPNVTTYELILRALSEAGDLNQATEVIANMKIQGLPATENVFNSLIICEGKAGNLKNIDEVLLMMNSLKLEPSADTYTAVVRAKALNKKYDEVVQEMEKAERNGYNFEERHVMEIVKTLAQFSCYGPIRQVLQFLPPEIRNTPSISPYMQSVATLLVFQNHPIAALEIYKCLPLPAFGPKDDQGLHGRSLVRDCVKASVPASVIGLVTQELMGSGRNPIALQNASEAALQLGKVPLALDLFTKMQQLGMPIRPHYFWPILMHEAKSYGEKGVMNVLKTMITMEVPPDYETMIEYILPNVSFSSPQNLMKKLMECGLTATAALTPTMETLLRTGQIRAASEICELFDGKVDAEKLMKPLVDGFLISSDLKSTIFILEDITRKALDKNKDWVGRYLCTFLQHKKSKMDLSDFNIILKGLRNTKLRITTTAAEYCINSLPDDQPVKTLDTFKEILYEIVDERLVDEGEMFAHQVPHPKHMNEQSLRAHLVELEAKGMNTRGVLRKLLQHYCRTGKLAEAREILEKCQKEDLYLSAGMKASIFDLHVKFGELDMAEMVLADINKTSPNFTLDEFKIIDFATLMVYNNKIARAIELIKEQSKKRKVKGGTTISKNCWRLLDATAAQGTPFDVREMFELLHSLGYCKLDNVIMGPLVRVHLKTNRIADAVNEFSRVASKYNKTPLKHELLCSILRDMGDGGKSEEEFILKEKLNGTMNKHVQTILNVDKKVHGTGDIHLTLIAAFADVGYKKSLRKMLLDPNVKYHPDALMRRCERFADEKKVQALETIADCARDIRQVDVVKIYDLILDVHQRDDKYNEALALWYRMQEANVTPSKDFIKNICSLLKSNNQSVPSDLSVLLDKQKQPKKAAK